jgi:hypothetical protein
MTCILSFPKAPHLDMSLSIPGSNLDAQRIRSRIDDQSMFLIRMENHLGVKVDRVYPLPNKPKDCPSWKYAITAPALLKKEKGLLFTLKEKGLFWTLEKEEPSNWVRLEDQIDKDFILASMEIDPTPHKLFCQELLHALDCFNKGKKVELQSQNSWPKNWHSKWLELLLETKVYEDSTSNTNSNQTFLTSEETTKLRFPMSLENSNNLLKRLRQGTIVSMAHRCSTELIEAQKLLKEKTSSELKDKTWASLLKLC